MIEEWRQVSGYEGLYEVSNLGRVRRCEAVVPVRGVHGKRRFRGGLLKPSLNTKGYEFVALCKDGQHSSQAIHRLVCRAFNGEPTKFRNHASHLDGNKLNNISTNLKWKSHNENMDDRYIHGTHFCGERNPAAKLTSTQVKEIRETAWFHGVIAHLARKFGVGRTAISNIRNGSKWREVPPG